MQLDDLVRAILERRALDARLQWNALFQSAQPASEIAVPRSKDALSLALAAGLAELLSERRGEAPPSWTSSVPALPEPFVVVTVRTRAKLAQLEEESPAPLRRRGVLAPAGYLTVA